MEQSNDPMKQQAGRTMPEMPMTDLAGERTADVHTPMEGMREHDKPVGELAKDLGKSAV